MDYASPDGGAPLLGERTDGGSLTSRCASTVTVEWDSAKHTCVARPALGLAQFEDPRQLLDDVRVDDSQTIAVIVHKFVTAALQIDPSLTTLNLARLYRNDDYRALAVDAARLGYRGGRDAALAEWKNTFEEFI